MALTYHVVAKITTEKSALIDQSSMTKKVRDSRDMLRVGSMALTAEGGADELEPLDPLKMPGAFI